MHSVSIKQLCFSKENKEKKKKNTDNHILKYDSLYPDKYHIQKLALAISNIIKNMIKNISTKLIKSDFCNLYYEYFLSCSN